MLAKRVEKDATRCHMSHVKIAETSGVSEPQMWRMINDLDKDRTVQHHYSPSLHDFRYSLEASTKMGAGDRKLGQLLQDLLLVAAAVSRLCASP